MRVHTIIPGKLYTSGHPREDPTAVSRLRHMWITHVICLVNKQSEVVRAEYGDRYIHFPMSDGLLMDRARWDELVSVVNNLYNEGWPSVLAHCNAGRNRSGLLAVLMFVEFTGLSPADALDYVRKIRPRAVANPAFEEYINDLQHSWLRR